MAGRKSGKTYSPVKEMINFVFKYMYENELKDIFKKGKLNVNFKNHGVDFIYTTENIEYRINFKIDNLETRLDKDKLLYTLQEFLLNVYYWYEWNGKEVKLETLAKLLGVIHQAVDQEIKKILNKLKDEFEYLSPYRELGKSLKKESKF